MPASARDVLSGGPTLHSEGISLTLTCGFTHRGVERILSNQDKLEATMKRKALLASAAIAALVTIGGAGPGWAGPVLEFSALSTGTPGFAASAGWSFTTKQAVKVTALDAFDPTGTGAGGVRLYTA